MKVLRTMYRPFRWKVLVSVVIGLVRIAASLAFVWICKALVDIATGVSAASLTAHVWYMVGIVFVQVASGLAFNYWQNLCVVKASAAMRYDVFERLMGSQWSGRDSFHSGDAVNRLEGDVDVLVQLFCVRFPDIAVTLFQLLAASVYLLTLAPNLLWLLLALMVVAVLGSRMCFKILRKLTSEIRALDSDVQEIMQENLQNRMLIKVLDATASVLEKLGYKQDALVRTTRRRLNFNLVARGFMNIGFLAGYTLAFLWGIYGIVAGTVTYGMMTAFLQLVGQVQRPISDLSRHIPAFIHSLASLERLKELTDALQEPKEERVMLAAPAGVRVNGISYAYPDSARDVLCNFSHDFAPGSFTVIAGPTGEGKSTLVRLICGLLRPDSGTVEVYDHTGASLQAGPASRGNFLFVPQGNTLLSGTVRENLALADPQATPQMMEEALKAAMAGFVFDLPQGLDTVCSEKGGGLSEGQAQRIAIARALLQKGSILILDEATSALDSKTEAEVLANIKAWSAVRKTVIFISHREAVLSYADSLVRVDSVSLGN